ncbi:MAG: glycosyltransferase [Nitrospiraceae bacterium]|nr:glycosyltransferase [Nitrospiraceae bacterium]
MKLALLCGNRFNPWHFQGYGLLPGDPEISVFRAESQIQRFFDERNDTSFPFDFQRIYFEEQVGNPLTRFVKSLRTTWSNREPRIVPFHERLKGYDVVQSWELFTDWSAQALLARERFDVPLAVIVWDNIPFNMERNPERRAIKKRVTEGADVFIVHTERSERMLDFEGVPAGKLVRLNPGVDTDAFSPGPGKRAEFGVQDDDFVVLFVGWFLPRKGIDFLLLALRELVQGQATTGRRVRLLMVGSGPGQDRVEQLIDRLGVRDSCVFGGALPYSRMPDAFRSADCFVLPSIATPEWQEQFGMSLIESMACGTPIVTTLSGAIPEVVGDNAILCQPNDFVALLDAIKRLILNPGLREDLAKAGRARAMEYFNLQGFAQGLSRVYEDLC